MRIYVASSWREPKHGPVVERLEAEGHEVYDFKHPAEDSPGFSWSEIDPRWLEWSPEEFRAALDHPLAEKGFAHDMDALEWCDACVHVVPETAGRSSHLELGFSAGSKRHTIILLNQAEPELMYKMAGQICVTIDEVVTHLASLESSEGGEIKELEERLATWTAWSVEVLDRAAIGSIRDAVDDWYQDVIEAEVVYLFREVNDWRRWARTFEECEGVEPGDDEALRQRIGHHWRSAKRARTMLAHAAEQYLCAGRRERDTREGLQRVIAEHTKGDG